MKIHSSLPQFLLRISLGIGFLSPVFDRIGWLGHAGEQNISWGNWSAFLNYVHLLLPRIATPLSNAMAWLATILEAILGLLLIIGFKTRYGAVGACLLTLVFMTCMTMAFGFKAPLNYSVPAFSAGALLLSTMPRYQWSIDALLTDQLK